MAKDLYLVTGATGKTGFSTVAELTKKGRRVRAFVHNNDHRVEKLRSMGAEIFIGNIFSPIDLNKSMTDVSCAYFCPPWHPHMLQSAVLFAVAAKEAKVKGIVALSQWLASPMHPSHATRQNWLMEEFFKMIPGISTVIVNPGFFADNYMALMPFAAHFGIFPMPIGNSRNAPPSNEDIARVIVSALIDIEQFAGQTFRPTGPSLLTAKDMALVFSKILNRRVFAIDMPMFMFFKAMRVMEIPAFQQIGVRQYVRDHLAGSFEVGAPNDHVKKLTGLEPESFEVIAARYARFPDAQRNVQSFLKAFWLFTRIGFTPAFNLDELEIEQDHPILSSSQLAIESDIWKKTRAGGFE